MLSETKFLKGAREFLRNMTHLKKNHSPKKSTTYLTELNAKVSDK